MEELTINNPKVGGQAIVERRWPQLTKRQSTAVLNEAKKCNMPIRMLLRSHLIIENPDAPVGTPINVGFKSHYHGEKEKA